MYYKNHFTKIALSPFLRQALPRAGADAAVGGAIGAGVSYLKNRKKDMSKEEKRSRLLKSMGTGAGIGLGTHIGVNTAMGRFSKENRTNYNKFHRYMDMN